jgi:ubiquinone/menaquinone biosynthesis C-methylase UbiE
MVMRNLVSTTSSIPNSKQVKYNLGCGSNRQEGFLGVDQIKTPQVDIMANLEEYPWKFAEDDSADEIYCCHYIEHVTDLIKFMDECYRILKVESKMTVIAPYYSSVRAWQDPTHKRAISENTFLYFNKGWRAVNGIEHYPIKSNFNFSYGYMFNPEWIGRSEEARAFAAKYYVNAVSDIQVILTKIGILQSV